MIHAQNEKLLATLPTAAVGATATSTLTIDRIGYDYVSISAVRASNASTTFANVLKIEESDDNSSYANVTDFVGGTAFTIPTVTDTNSASIVKLDVDCRARKRYLKVSMTPGATATLSLIARLSRAEETPTTVSEAGVIGWVKG